MRRESTLRHEGDRMTDWVVGVMGWEVGIGWDEDPRVQYRIVSPGRKISYSLHLLCSALTGGERDACLFRGCALACRIRVYVEPRASKIDMQKQLEGIQLSTLTLSHTLPAKTVHVACCPGLEAAFVDGP